MTQEDPARAAHASGATSQELGIGLRPGADHYRAYVGPPEDYDLVAAMTFGLLTALGLRQHHALLDIGCGSLRIGRVLIPYLNRGNYVGIEPNEALVDEGLRRELGVGILTAKSPLFIYADSADQLLGRRCFDFALAQSILSHCGPDLLEKWIGQAAQLLAPTGALVATFVRGEKEAKERGWVYPGIVRYRDDTVRAYGEKHGLVFQVLDWPHPRQTWVLLSRPGFDTSWFDGRPLGWNTWFDHGRSQR